MFILTLVPAFAAALLAPAFLPPPAPPSGFAAAPVSATQMALTWTDNATDETGFLVERMMQVGGAWSAVATLGIDATSFADAGLTANARYDYRVSAFNASGASAALRAFGVTHPARIPVPSGFSIGMPIVEGEIGTAHLRLLPFGVHQSALGSGNHTYDGHPGWDIEYAAGASVRAAAAGSVQSVTVQGASSTVQVQHQQGSVFRRTVYNGMNSVAPGIAAGASIVKGQVLGTPKATTVVIQGAPSTSYTIHFQLDDFSLPPTATGANDNSVDPFPYLDGGGRAVFGRIWRQVSWREELVEPFSGQPRIYNPYPVTRAWALKSGAHAARIDFRHLDPATSPVPQYALFDANGMPTESGTVQLWATPGYATMDLQPVSASGLPQGAARLGRYDILSGAMRIDFGAPGAPRPATLANASTYVSP